MFPDSSLSENRHSIIHKLPYVFIFLFATLLVIGMYYHEMWRDELEIYGKIAFNGEVDNGGNYGYFVYNFLMKLFLWVNESQAMYQFYHYLIIVSAIFLLNKYAPFTLFEKFFITFSYFFFYEYGVISRSYGFMVLMVFLILFFLSRKKINFYLVLIPLISLANLGINSLIIALPLLLYILNILIGKYKNKKLSQGILLSYFGVVLFFIFMGITYVLFTYGQKSRWDQNAAAPFFMTIRCIWNIFVPIPEITSNANFWNTNYFSFPETYSMNYSISEYLTINNIILAVLSAGIFIIILIKFSKKPIVFWLFLGNYILLLFFLHIAKFYYIRHQGLLFLVFIYCYWLYHIADEKLHIPILNKINLTTFSKIKIDWIFKPMIILFLLTQFISSSYAFYKELNYKFTLSHDAANFIRLNKLDSDHIMVGFIDFAVQSIAINLKKKIYYPQSNSFGYVWVPYDNNYHQNISIKEVLNPCINYSEKQDKKVLLIMNFPLIDNNYLEVSNSMVSSQSSITLIKSFTGNIIQRDEQFWLYEVKKVSD